MDRRSFLRGFGAVLGGAWLGVPATAKAVVDPRKVPGGVIWPDKGDREEKARMAVISNPRLADMIRKYNMRHGEGDNRVRRFQEYRGLIRSNPESYARMVSKGWVERDPEKQLQKLWDREWEKYGPVAV